MMAVSLLLLGIPALMSVATVLGELTPTPTTPLGNEMNTALFSKTNSYGAPIPPWVQGSTPGWSHCPLSFGKCDANAPSMQHGTSLCNVLSYFADVLHCPQPSSYNRYTNKKRSFAKRQKREGRHVAKRTVPSPSPNPYSTTFTARTGATQAGDYMTYGLVDSVEACQAMCDAVQGCHFVNTYHDVNGKDGSTLLTCSLFAGCHDITTATNTGGQTQPNGSVNYIADSTGWCKA